MERKDILFVLNAAIETPNFIYEQENFHTFLGPPFSVGNLEPMLSRSGVEKRKRKKLQFNKIDAAKPATLFCQYVF